MKLAAAALLLLAACSTAAPTEQAPHSASAQLETLFADVWQLLSAESLLPQPMPGGAVSTLLERRHGAGTAGSTAHRAVAPAALAALKPAPPERPAAQWVAAANSDTDAWELLRRAQAAEAGPAAVVAATLPAHLAAHEHATTGGQSQAGAAALLPAHPKLTLNWWFARNESSLDVVSRPLGNATFLSLKFSKTRLLRNLPDGRTQEYFAWDLTLSISTLALACCALGLLCLALYPWLSREDEDCCDCDCDCGCDCDCDCDAGEKHGFEVAPAGEGGSSLEHIKAAGYSKL